MNIFEPLRDLTLLSIAVRLLLATFCAGVIGLERSSKRRSAGFRTHILICLGAAIPAMTGQFLPLYMGEYTDMTRLGAQVIAGIGFIGAGAIIKTQRRKIKGLTTAAGLWTTAIIGLCFGAGFYEGGIIAAVMVLFVELVMVRIERWMFDHASDGAIYTEYRTKTALTDISLKLNEIGCQIQSVEFDRIESPDDEKKLICAVLQIHITKGLKIEDVIREMNRTKIKDVVTIEEL